jgi:hypothetical protein
MTTPYDTDEEFLAEVDRSLQIRALAQARLQLESIVRLVAAYDAAREQGSGEAPALEDIQNSPLAVSVRSDWTQPGSKFEPGEYQILLCTGGPACRIVGDLERGEPVSASLEYQDWFTPWQLLPTSSAENEALVEYARCFYFGN